MRNTLHCSRAGADDRDALIGQTLHARARGVAAGVGVVPATGVERLARERFEPGNAGQLGHVQTARAEAHELRREIITAMREDVPARIRRVPAQRLDFGVEQRLVIQAVLSTDAPAMLEDLRPARVFLGRHVAGLFEQRHVHERRGVALRAGIAVPIPSAAEVAALVDHPHVADSRFDQARGRHEPGETSADACHRDVIAHGLARPDGQIRVVEVM